MTFNPHVRVAQLYQLRPFLEKINEEFFRLAQHPSRVGDEESEEDSANGQFTLDVGVDDREVFWNVPLGIGALALRVVVLDLHLSDDRRDLLSSLVIPNQLGVLMAT